LNVTQPIREAKRNQSLAGQETGAAAELFPSLTGGIILLDIDGGRGVPILQSLVLDHLLRHDGPSFWVDANGHATTTTLAQIAPSRRILDRINVARGFTPFQHYAAVCDVPTAVDQSLRGSIADAETDSYHSSPEDTSQYTPSLIVVPAVDAQYRGTDTLSDTHAETLQARTLAQLSAYADGYEIPVLVTRSQRDGFTTPVETAADHHIQCEQTRMGPRFVGDDFETLVYPVDDGAYYQTTFAYWRQLLAARAAQVGVEPRTPAPSAPTPEGVGTGVTADGETVAATTDPLLDAWTATDAGDR
jgi:hypothetical protein